MPSLRAGNKYPGYLSNIVGHDKPFSQITRSTQAEAHSAMETYVREVMIPNSRNTVKINGNKVLLHTAPDCKQKETIIRKHLTNHAHGIDDFLNLLDKVKEGALSLPTRPRATKCSHPHAAARPPAKRHRFVGDPSSPSVVRTDQCERNSQG